MREHRYRLESYRYRELPEIPRATTHCARLWHPCNACQLALEGRGHPDLQDEVIATIAWQATQIQRVCQLLEHLAEQGLITDMVDGEIADQALEDHGEDVVRTVVERFYKDDELLGLMSPRLKAMLVYTSTMHRAGWLESWLITG